MSCIIIKGNGDPKIKDAYFVRDEVFTKEQGYPAEIDVDEYDEVAYQAILYKDNLPVGTARLIPIHGLKGKIGRVAILKSHRDLGLGVVVMEALMSQAEKVGMKNLSLSAQVYAIPFYEKLGFSVEGEEHLEDGEPHINMTKAV